jgi:hypothetical protein
MLDFRKGLAEAVRVEDRTNRQIAQMSPMNLAVVGDGMMRSVCELSRETLPGQIRCSCLRAEEPAGEGVRASVVAGKRVTTVEPRDAGRWMGERRED